MFVDGGSGLWGAWTPAGLGVNLRSIFASCGISRETFDRGTEEDESVLMELLREWYGMLGGSGVTLGCFLRRTFLGCFDVSWDRLEGPDELATLERASSDPLLELEPQKCPCDPRLDFLS